MPGSECTNPYCEDRYNSAESYEELRDKLLEHHRHSASPAALGGGMEGLAFHACKYFYIYNDEGVLETEWVFGHGDYSGTFSTAGNGNNP